MIAARIYHRACSSSSTLACFLFLLCVPDCYSFHKENGFAEDEQILRLHASRILKYSDMRIPPATVMEGKCFSAMRVEKAKKFYSQENHDHLIHHGIVYSTSASDCTHSMDTSSSKERMPVLKKLPSAAVDSKTVVSLERDEGDAKLDSFKLLNNKEAVFGENLEKGNASEVPLSKVFLRHPSRYQHKASWGHWVDHPSLLVSSSIICRICEEEVATLHVEDHSRICTIANRCDQKESSVVMSGA